MNNILTSASDELLEQISNDTDYNSMAAPSVAAPIVNVPVTETNLIEPENIQGQKEITEIVNRRFLLHFDKLLFSSFLFLYSLRASSESINSSNSD